MSHLRTALTLTFAGTGAANALLLASSRTCRMSARQSVSRSLVSRDSPLTLVGFTLIEFTLIQTVGAMAAALSPGSDGR